METESPITSSKKHHEDSSSVKLFLNTVYHTDDSARNISIQTGEEFSPEFIRHRAVPRCDPSRQLVYEDLTGILGLRTESGISPQNSDINPPSISNFSETDGRRFIRNPSDQFFDATCFGQISPSSRFPVPIPVLPEGSPPIYHPCFHVGPETFSSEKVKFLCSFGGKILLRPGDRKLRYVGGDTRIVSVRKGMAFDDLSRKTASIFNQLHNIKYQLPGEDLDSLISVASDEDLHHMMEEFLQLDLTGGSPRLRLFLIPSGEPDSFSSSEVVKPFEHHSDVDYFVAVNGCAESSPRKKGSGMRRPMSRAAWSGNVGEGAFGAATDGPDSSNNSILRVHMTRNLSEQNGFIPSTDPNRFHHQLPESRLVNVCSLSSLKGKNNNFGNQLQNDGAVILEDLLGDPKKLSLRRGMFHVGSDIRLQEEEEDEVQLTPLPLPNIYSNIHGLENKLLGQVSCIIPAATVRGNSGGDYGFLLDKVTVSGEEGGPGTVESGPSGMIGCALDKPPCFGSLVSSPVIDGRHVMKDYIPESRRPKDSGWRSRDMLEENEARNLPLGSPSSFEDDTNVMDEAPSGFNSNDEDMDESISDATLAEIEAGIYGLQIIKNGDLEELKELGSGTFGTVYHGKWRGTDVAIKRIKKSCFSGKPSEQQRLIKDFWREAQILSNLHHPNVVAFYGVVPDGPDGTLATLTEFMVNGSLKHSLSRKDRALDRRKRMIIAMDAAFGMEYLHLRNIVHFDLKCDNLLVNLRDPQRPICKVGDFGLSRIKQNTLVTGGVRGTLPWMAPELLDGSSSRVSEKVDVFSFGVVMWELLTGEEPYANMHCGAIIGGIVNNTLRPPVPERCEPRWRKLMEECWSHHPSARPSFTEITTRLRLMSISLNSKRLCQPT